MENKIKKENLLVNFAKTKNKVKLQIYGGIVTGNIIETAPEPIGLDFSYASNSQYIPVI